MTQHNQYLVTANHLNLRKDPSLTGKMCGSLQAGEVVECFKISGDDYWMKVRNTQGVQGWATHKHLVNLANVAQIGEEELGEQTEDNAANFPWMTVAIREMGVYKYTGYRNHPRIVEYLSSVTLGHDAPVQDDIYWNAAFVNWCVEKAGYDGTDSTWARAWHNWGQPIDTPCRGCVVVLRQGETGQVGFFVQAVGDKVELIGANKLNEVGYHYYHQRQVMSYRVPFGHSSSSQ